MVSREDFLKEWKFPLQPKHDFELLNSPAEYTPGHPKEWGQETDSIDFGEALGSSDETAYKDFACAISPDKRLLVIASSKDNRVLIYDIHFKELRQVLDGAAPVCFRPISANEEDVHSDKDDATAEQDKPTYTLICGKPNDDDRYADSGVIFWDLDQYGRLLDDEEPIDPSALAKKAIDAIALDLKANHEWSEEFIASSRLQADFEKALGKVSAEHRRKHNTILEGALLGNFGSEVFSSDGKLMLYNSGRRKEKRHSVIVYDIDAGKAVHTLKGHTDNIMWFGFSPNDQHIATIAWDGSLRMYSAATGELTWATEKGNHQSWAGAFSPDSQYIIWSSQNGSRVAVHAVADGKLVSKFPEKYHDWCRWLKWHPHPQAKQVAFCAGMSVWVWRPFEGPNGTTTQRLVLQTDDAMCMSTVLSVNWLQEGRLLCVDVDEGSTLVWDTTFNTKELFKRPDGHVAAWVEGGLFAIPGQDDARDFYISVDGDSKVRYWESSVATAAGWWEKAQENEVKAKKKAQEKYPETGKYVNIVKPKAEENLEESGREKWAEHGAALWTAE